LYKGKVRSGGWIIGGIVDTGTKTKYTISNVAKVLKAEISGISRRRPKNSIEGMGTSYRGPKKIVADLKRRVVLLEKDEKGLAAAMRRYQAEYPETPPEETKRVRLTSKGIRSLRRKLPLTQADFGTL
jgi:hypothetical protein